MKKWKNRKHSSLPNSITERTMFFKMQNSAAFKSLRISTTEKEKKCKRNFVKTLIFLPYLCNLHILRYPWGQHMTKMYTPSVPRDNLPKKSICRSLLIQLIMQKLVWNTNFYLQKLIVIHLFTETGTRRINELGELHSSPSQCSRSMY